MGFIWALTRAGGEKPELTLHGEPVCNKTGSGQLLTCSEANAVVLKGL